VKYDVACSGGSVGAGARFNVASGATSASLAYFATGVSAGPITCSLTFVAGSDARFTNAALTPTTFTLTAAVNPGASSSSSSSTGGNNGGSASSSSSSSSGSNDAAGGSSGGGGGGGNFLAAGEGSGSSGLSDGAKAAIAVGVIMGVGLLAGIIYVLVAKFGLSSAAAGAGAAGGAASAGVPVTGPGAV